jgi:spore coat protein U-like protein
MALALAGSALLVAGTSPPLRAATGTTNLSVSATVTRNCTITTTPVVFGAYDPVVANATTGLDGTGALVVACTKGTTATIGLGLGGNVLGAVRRMADGATNFLSYDFFKETTRTTTWGTSGAEVVDTGVAPSKVARTFSVYGRVAPNQDVPAGTFTDIVVATVNF